MIGERSLDDFVNEAIEEIFAHCVKRVEVALEYDEEIARINADRFDTHNMTIRDAVIDEELDEMFK